MEFAPSIQVEVCPSFCVCYFRDINKPKEPEPHYRVVVPTNDKSARLFLIITDEAHQAEIEELYSIPEKDKARKLKSVLHVNRTKMPLLKYDSLIDCNKAELINLKELDRRVDPKHGFKIKTSDVSPKLQWEIKMAIRNSPIVKKNYKFMI